MKYIAVPVNKDAMIRLDYDECIKGDLIELYLDSMDFDKLWASGVLKKLNDSLHIMIDDYESEENILLLELAKQFSDWLVNLGDFSYYSMDYEDGPLLFFKENNKSWDIGSIWMKTTYSNIELHQLTNACKCFIEQLTRDLKVRNIHCKDLFE